MSDASQRWGWIDNGQKVTFDVRIVRYNYLDVVGIPVVEEEPFHKSQDIQLIVDQGLLSRFDKDIFSNGIGPELCQITGFCGSVKMTSLANDDRSNSVRTLAAAGENPTDKLKSE